MFCRRGRSSWALAALVLAAALIAPTAAAAETAFVEDFEGGAPGWSATGLWRVQDHPEQQAVDARVRGPLSQPPGATLPAAHAGTGAAWFGDPASGTYCAGFDTIAQQPGNGCRSAADVAGELVTPSFDLSGAATAHVRLHAWWEIEASREDEIGWIFDFATVSFRVGGGEWQFLGALTPAGGPKGTSPAQSFGTRGLGAEPAWEEMLFDLSAAAGHADVQLRFTFGSSDRERQGFRGVLIDDVEVDVPYDVGGPPAIDQVPACIPSVPAGYMSIAGQRFVAGSTVHLRGPGLPETKLSGISAPIVESGALINLRPPSLAPATYEIQVRNPNGDASAWTQLLVRESCLGDPDRPIVEGLSIGCLGEQAPGGHGGIVLVHGRRFVPGVRVFVDGRQLSSGSPGSYGDYRVLSDTRIEIDHAAFLPVATRTVRVDHPGGARSNTFAVVPCPPPQQRTISFPSADPSDERRPTETEIRCDRGPNPGDSSRCTATVADAGPPPRRTPTGLVRMSSRQRGTFRGGDTCRLGTPSSSSPSIATCELVYMPPVGFSGFPKIDASYLGSDVHAPSAAETGLIQGVPAGLTALGPDDCGAVAGSLEQARSGRSGDPPARAAIDIEYAPPVYREEGWGEWAWRNAGYCAESLWNLNYAARSGLVGLWGVAATGIPGAVGGAMGFEVGNAPGAAVGAGLGLKAGYDIAGKSAFGAAGGIWEAGKKAQQDPPDPNFRVIDRPMRPRWLRFRSARRGLPADQARALTRFTRGLARARVQADALATAVDRAGGAQLAGDDLWEGRQTRAAIRYANRLATELTRTRPLAQAVARNARRNRAARRTFSRRALRRSLQRLARRGPSRSERRLLGAIGFDAADIRTMRAEARLARSLRTPRSIAASLASRSHLDMYRGLARFFRLWAATPQVVLRGRLKGDDRRSARAVRSQARARGRRARVAITCPRAAGEPCRGTVTLFALRRGRIDRSSPLGGDWFTVAPGATRTLTVGLSADGRRALGRRRAARTRVVVATTGVTRTRSHAITLRRR